MDIEKNIFLNGCQHIFNSSKSYLIERGHEPLYKQTSIPFTQKYFVSSLLKLAHVWLWRKRFIHKVISLDNRQ